MLVACGACTAQSTASADPDTPDTSTAPSAAPAPTSAEPEWPVPRTQDAYVAPDGNDDQECTESAPCRTFARALRMLPEGGHVLVNAGSYPGQEVVSPPNTEPAGGSDPKEPTVLIRPVDAEAEVTVEGMTIEQPGVMVSSMRSEGSIMLREHATSSGFDQIIVDGGGAFINGTTRGFLRNSEVVPLPDKDALQIKAFNGSQPTRLVIEGNTFGPTSRGPERGHVDCIQVLGGSELIIRDNTLFHCASQGLLVGSGAGGTVGPDNRFEDNLIQLCPERTETCDGHHAVAIYDGEDAVFVNNTVLDGGTVFESPGATVTGNIFSLLKICDNGTFRYNLVITSRCSLGDTNVVDIPAWVHGGQSPPDPRLAPDSPGVELVPRDEVTGLRTSTPDRDPIDAGVLLEEGAR